MRVTSDTGGLINMVFRHARGEILDSFGISLEPDLSQRSLYFSLQGRLGTDVLTIFARSSTARRVAFLRSSVDLIVLGMIVSGDVDNQIALDVFEQV